MTALMSNKVGGSNYHPIADPLFAMLRDDSSDMGFQMISRSQRAIAAQYKKDVIEPFKNLNPTYLLITCLCCLVKLGNCLKGSE